MATKRKSLSGAPPVTDASGKPLSLELLQQLPDIWSGWQKDSSASQEILENGGNLSPGQTQRSTTWLRKALKNPAFVEAFTRLKTDMELASQAPLRSIVIHYRAEQPLYSSDEVMLHVSTHQALQHFLVLCSRQGRIRPSHPSYPFGADGFTAHVIKNPMSKEV